MGGQPHEHTGAWGEACRVFGDVQQLLSVIYSSVVLDHSLPSSYHCQEDGHSSLGISFFS